MVRPKHIDDGLRSLGLLAALTFAGVSLLTACPPALDGRPEERCYAECKARAEGCTADECARGCRFVLDRLVESEDRAVLGCVTLAAKAAKDKSADRCGDAVWARCAVTVGIHADGGPPLPQPVGEDREDESSGDDDAPSENETRKLDAGAAPVKAGDAGKTSAVRDAAAPEKRDAGKPTKNAPAPPKNGGKKAP